jgi:hypothetical protein
MKKTILLFLVFLPCIVSSQTWQQYSDSLIHYINKNNIEKANYFDNLIDIQLNYQKIIKDTIYSDYLYRKGVLRYRQGKFSPKFFEESISIWNESPKKNYLKLSKVYYFLADGYNAGKDFSNAYLNYEKCYLLNKQFNLKFNTYFSSSIYCLSVIDYRENFNFKKAQQYAIEYIELNKKIAYLNFDFNYAYAFRWKDDLKGYENVLLEFNSQYENQSLNNSDLYFQINYLLFDYYRKQFFYYKQNKNNEIIKYGEKAIEINNKLNKKYDNILQEIYLELALSYSEKKDEVNEKKYNNLKKK